MAKTLVVLADLSGEYSGMSVHITSEETITALMDRLQNGSTTFNPGEAAPAQVEGAPPAGAGRAQHQQQGAAGRAGAAGAPWKGPTGTAGNTPAPPQK